MRSFLTEHGISVRISCPYIPPQNGVAERRHQHLVTLARTSLLQSHLQTSFWTDAVCTVNHVINRLPLSSINYATLFSLINGHTPDYSLLRPFGCLCFPYTGYLTRHKLSVKVVSCVFLGYSDSHKGYRCYDPITERLYISCHVRFQEDTFPYRDLLLRHPTTSPDDSGAVQIPFLLPVPNSQPVQDVTPTALVPPATSSASIGSITSLQTTHLPSPSVTARIVDAHSSTAAPSSTITIDAAAPPSWHPMSQSNTSLFYLYTTTLTILLLLYVDDMLLIRADCHKLDALVAALSSHFALKDLSFPSHFLDVHIESFARASFSPKLTTPSNCCKIIILYLTMTRPDIAFSVNQLSQFLHSPTTEHACAAKRILRYLKGSSTIGRPLLKTDLTRLTTYADVDWAGCPATNRSTTGYAVFLCSTSLSWRSKKQPTVSRSSNEAEYRALAYAAVEIMWISSLCREIGLSLADR
ncbi:hypothetical protein MLD38_014035 [Melastoma candidum]|uniref:Uncharacterized protein n=1 Tax=Melastoma candidum TaxID=119954 RepID=A0ACB9RC27_9MYRT|nr:hypothetical protein MLD38_014035 [Melastoma candidum]